MARLLPSRMPCSSHGAATSACHAVEDLSEVFQKVSEACAGEEKPLPLPEVDLVDVALARCREWESGLDAVSTGIPWNHNDPAVGL
jgi:hypothetical protein